VANSILRLPAVKALTGLSRSTIYNRIAEGTFPRPLPLGPRSVGWLSNELDAWISQRIKDREERR
jgi:prophage regulatory protein